MESDFDSPLRMKVNRELELPGPQFYCLEDKAFIVLELYEHPRREIHSLGVRCLKKMHVQKIKLNPRHRSDYFKGKKEGKEGSHSNVNSNCH